MTRRPLWLALALLTLFLGVGIFLTVRHRHRSAATPLTNIRIEDARVYINQDLKWEYLSKQLDPEAGGYHYTTNERVLMFFADGTFASINCMLYQPDGSHTPMFIPNEGFAVSKGTWKLNDDGTVTTTSRLVSSNKLPDDAISKGHQLLTETFIIHDVAVDRTSQRLDLNGRAFVPGPQIDRLRELLLMPPGDI